jgi:predicted RNA-binding Zn-ribbon protein involved in translation (DUF1610 family)
LPSVPTQDVAVVLVCPNCGSDRVISLTFSPIVLTEVVIEMPDRPIAKCADCAHRLTAVEVAAQEQPAPD